MATVTNAMIIESYKAENNISISIHTYAKWKQLGYQVKKGEKCQHRITIWKGCTKRTEKEDGTISESTRVIMKTACFFTLAQVEPVKNN